MSLYRVDHKFMGHVTPDVVHAQNTTGFKGAQINLQEKIKELLGDAMIL